MLINCTLEDFMIPGFSGVNPEFGTKKPDGQSISARENNTNVMLPFKRQRPFVVTENSVTSAVEAHSLFAIQTAGATLTLGDGAFSGCEVKVINISTGGASLSYSGVTISLQAGEEINFWWNGSAWKLQKTSSHNYADEVDGTGRNLFDVLGVSTIPAAMAELRRRCNNAGEIDSTGIPDFTGIMHGDYIDGLDLSGITAPTSGTAPQAWNDTYKNNRIIVSGFNTFKGAGDTENAKNHVLMTFRNVIALGRMNSSNDNTGGYPASELRAWLEGATGNGSGVFATALKAALGGEYLCTIRKAHSIKSSYTWGNYTVWPPSELEVFGIPLYGDEGVYMVAITSPAIAARVGYLTPVQFPIYQKSYAYRIKRWNGARQTWWELTPAGSSTANFCNVNNNGTSTHTSGSSVLGCAPAFCVA
jgi:hypothetical protein